MAARRFFASAEKHAQRLGRGTELRAAVLHDPAPEVHVVDQAAQHGQVITADRYLTPEQVADRLQLPSAKRVYDLIHQHGLPAKRVGRLFRIIESEFQRWMREDLHAQSAPLRVMRGGRS